MAKNLYYITSALDNRAAPEGYPYNQKTTYVTLVPTINNYKDSGFRTTDPDKFWSAPH